MTARMVPARRAPRHVFGALPLPALLVVHPAPAPGAHAYAPALYGPDLPPGEVVQELGITLVDGQWLPEAVITVVKSERRLAAGRRHFHPRTTSRGDGAARGGHS